MFENTLTTISEYNSVRDKKPDDNGAYEYTNEDWKTLNNLILHIAEALCEDLDTAEIIALAKVLLAIS